MKLIRFNFMLILDFFFSTHFFNVDAVTAFRCLGWFILHFTLLGLRLWFTWHFINLRIQKKASTVFLVNCQMMAEHGKTQELSEEQKLQTQLQQIHLDYQKLVSKHREMAPKGTGAKKTDPSAENSINDEDLEGKSLCTHFFLIFLCFRISY